MKTKDLLITGLLFGLIITTGNNIYNSNKIYKLQKEVLETKKEAINIYYENKDYINTLEDSRKNLNDYIDTLEKDIKEYKYLDKLKKDLR